MSNGLEIAGACVTVTGALWLSIDAFLVRNRIRAEAGAERLLEILKRACAEQTVTDPNSGKPLDSNRDLSLWLAGRTITWNWVALGLITIGFALDLAGKLTS